MMTAAEQRKALTDELNKAERSGLVKSMRALRWCTQQFTICVVVTTHMTEILEHYLITTYPDVDARLVYDPGGNGSYSIKFGVI